MVLAEQFGHASFELLLLAAGAATEATDPKGRTALHRAVAAGHTAAAAARLSAGANLQAADDQGWTPLHHTAVGQDDRKMAMVELLLSNHADVNAAALDGSTPMHCAVNHNMLPWSEVGSAKLLVAAGAHLAAADQCGKTALHYAAAN